MSSWLTSLEAWWALEDANDSHGSNNLTNSGVAFAAGKVNNAGDFELNDPDFMEIADNASLSVSDVDFCFVGWFKAETMPGAADFDIIFSKHESGSVRSYQLQLTDSKADFAIFNSSGTNVGNKTNSTSLSAGTWYFFYVEHSATGNTVGISINNGTLETGATSGVPSDTAALFRLGARLTTETNFYDGLVDELAFYKGRLLDATERTFLYNSGNGKTYADLTTTVSPPALNITAVLPVPTLEYTFISPLMAKARDTHLVSLERDTSLETAQRDTRLTARKS